MSLGSQIRPTADGLVTDHKNLDALDNRRGNLRAATTRQNNSNRRSLREKGGLPRGVFRRKNRYEAAISKDMRKIYLGLYATADEAHAAYRKAAIEHFGEFARFD